MTSELTRQEVFDIVAEHLLTQRMRSVEPNDASICLYRGQNGLKCAVGILITDDEYSREMEYKNVSVLKNKNLLPERLIPHSGLLTVLQSVHDTPPTKNWKKELKKVCKNYQLQWNFGLFYNIKQLLNKVK